MKASLRNRTTCLWARDVAPPVKDLSKAFPWIWLDGDCNEAVLLHGTERETAEKIIRQGFDERLCHRHYYGRGIYLTTDFCKACQLGPQRYTPPLGLGLKNREMAGVNNLVVYMQTVVKYNTFFYVHTPPRGHEAPPGGLYTNCYILQQFAYTPPNGPHQPFPYFF